MIEPKKKWSTTKTTIVGVIVVLAVLHAAAIAGMVTCGVLSGPSTSNYAPPITILGLFAGGLVFVGVNFLAWFIWKSSRASV